MSFQKWGNEGAQAKDSQPQGNLDALVCYSRNGKEGSTGLTQPVPEMYSEYKNVFLVRATMGVTNCPRWAKTDALFYHY